MSAHCQRWSSFALAFLVIAVLASVARAELIADLAADYQAASLGQSTQTINGGAGILDTAGTGNWNYLQANGGGGGASLLTYLASPGNSGQPGYGGSPGGSESTYSVPALSSNIIFGDGVAPPAGSVNVHPGNENPVEIIARWTAGQSGVMNIAGAVRDVLPSSNGVQYVIRRNGADQFAAPLSINGRQDGSNLLLNINAGDTIDLVVGPNGAYGGDESHAQLRVSQLGGTLVANLGGDYSESGQPIGATGSGTWQYYSSDNINLDATANKALLTVKSIGGAGNTGYGGTGTSNMPAVNDQIIYPDGETPLDNELSVHPGENGNPHEYAVMRWTAGADEGGLANIVGNVRNPVLGGDGIDFHVLVDGVSLFDVVSTSNSQPLTFFDISTMISPGSTVDFVLGNNSAGYGADESIIAAFISVQAVPEPVSLALWGILSLVGGAFFAARHSRFRKHTAN